MTDKVLCPWCGAEMRYKQLDHINGFYDCPQCLATGPAGRGEADARAAALRRYEPPIGPLTLEEAKHIEEDDYVWLEDKLMESTYSIFDGDSVSGWLKRWGESYGKTWRCWPRKPTEEE